jgi:VanZ family protein
MEVSMKFLFQDIRKYPLSSACIALIWILSLIPFFPETPLDNVEFIDKWVHILMYGGTFTVLWIEYRFKHKSADYEKLFFWAWLMPIVMSGIIELLQEYCTFGHRNGDWIDLLANTVGVTLAAVFGLVILQFHSR